MQYDEYVLWLVLWFSVFLFSLLPLPVFFFVVFLKVGQAVGHTFLNQSSSNHRLLTLPDGRLFRPEIVKPQCFSEVAVPRLLDYCSQNSMYCITEPFVNYEIFQRTLNVVDLILGSNCYLLHYNLSFHKSLFHTGQKNHLYPIFYVKLQCQSFSVSDRHTERM